MPIKNPPTPQSDDDELFELELRTYRGWGYDPKAFLYALVAALALVACCLGL